MGENFACFVVEQLMKYTINPILCQFKYMFCYKSKIETLKDKVIGVNGLQNKERELQQLRVEAERNAEAIKPGVTDLLDKADKLKEQAKRILESETNSEIQCLFLTCPNLKTRYSLGREATEKIAEVAELLKEFTYEKAGEPKPVVQAPYQNPGDFEAFETSISTKKEIMEALKDQDDVSIIGIWGMPGAGKTTMAHEIDRQVKFDKLFDDVAFVTVSQDADVTKIQGDLAEALGLYSMKEKSSINMRARLLRERLGGDASESILVILDDVWKFIDLKKIGIPVPSAGDGQRLKILLTSRNRDVCTEIGARKILDVKLLDEEESWKLFKGKAEISDDATDVIKRTAKEVAGECRGLPLALVTVGRALKEKPEYVWKSALRRLRNCEGKSIYGIVYSSIMLSYDYLERDGAKSLLRLCSLFPEDYNIAIEDLVRYAWGLKLIRDAETLIIESAREEVNTIVDDLKSRYLLLSVKNQEHVKLHDVVRDVCLQMVHEDKDAYMSKHGSLKEWPERFKNESCSAIGLTWTELNHLPSGLEYPNLKFLLMLCQQQSLNVSGDFFADMKELRVLHFTSMRIQIPSSIRLLTNLRTLCLDHCTLNIDVSTIGNLKKLEVLSFLGSNLDHFPSDIAELSNLRLLDLRLKHSSMYCPLPSGILLKLTKLEELHMGIIQIRDDVLEQARYIIEEIRSLTCLNTFQISTNDPQFLLQILELPCIDKLERFHIELTDFEYARKNITKYYYFRKRLHICGITYASMLLESAINSLMCSADHLSIKMDTEKKNMSDEDCFEYLNGNHRTVAFEGLQEISLWGMPRMKHLWRGVIKPPSLHSLTILTIKSCPSVKSLFSESVALSMVNLQSINISFCDMLEEIVSMDTEQNEVTQMLKFPKLQEINLEDLKNFKSFRSGSNKLVGVHNPLFEQVTLFNLERLTISKLGCTVKILDELKQIKSHKLRKLKVEHSDDVSILFDFEYTKDDAEIGILSQLTSLTVRYLPKLVHITRMFKGNHIFENLTDLTLSHCQNLIYLLSPSMANSLVALKYLVVWECEALEEIIGTREGTTSKIVFLKLLNLILRHLDRFRLLSSHNYELEFPLLEYLQIENCPVMTKFCSRQSAPILDKVWINFDQSIDISNFMDSEGFIPIRDDGKFFDTSNIVEDTEINAEAYWLQKKTAEAAKLQVEGRFQRVQTPYHNLDDFGAFETMKLQEEGTFQRVQTPYHNLDDFGAFETRISTKKEIKEALKDKDVSIIGIYGMVGVGKTTMAKEIVNEVKVDNLFDEIAFAVVSQESDITKIQDQLAEMLGLKIEEKFNKILRAKRLRKRLGGDRGKSILIILDDVWEDIELGAIGIPSAGDDTRLKILLTSRFKDVCCKMGAQRNFQVNILSEEESWELFKDSANISDDATDVIKSTAKKVARECCGLPLALVAVGRALRNKKEHEWKNALEELRNSSVTNIRGMHSLVYSRIEFSYNCLGSEEAKSLLLLISMVPEGHSIAIEDLVRHAWELKLFKCTKTLSTTRDRVNSIIDELKSCYLLLSTDNDDNEDIEERVELHGVVRDACLQIASKDKPSCMSKFTGLNFEGVTKTR